MSEQFIPSTENDATAFKRCNQKISILKGGSKKKFKHFIKASEISFNKDNIIVDFETPSDNMGIVKTGKGELTWEEFNMSDDEWAAYLIELKEKAINNAHKKHVLDIFSRRKYNELFYSLFNAYDTLSEENKNKLNKIALYLGKPFMIKLPTYKASGIFYLTFPDNSPLKNNYMVVNAASNNDAIFMVKSKYGKLNKGIWNKLITSEEWNATTPTTKTEIPFGVLF